MKLELSPRAQAIIVLALVAVCSAMVGILADRLLAQQSAGVAVPRVEGPSRGPGGGPGGPGGLGGQLRYIELLGEQLALTERQQGAIDSIVAEQRQRVHALQQEIQPRFRQIAEQTRASIDRVLTDSQRQQLRQLRQERARQDRLRLRDRVDRRPEL
jgi:hypothetical protein